MKNGYISTTEEIKSYYQDVFDVLYAKDNAKQIFPEKYEHLKKRFMFLYNEFEHLCARAYYINKEFIKGFKRHLLIGGILCQGFNPLL